MKRLALTLALLSGFVLGGVAISTAVEAQEDRPRGRQLRGPTESRDTSGEVISRDGKAITDAQAKEFGLNEAPAVIQRAGVNCTLADALATGNGKVNINGAQVDVKTYEVACNEGLGFMLQDRGAAGAFAFDCIQVAASAAAAPAAAAAPPARGQAPAAAAPATCRLPANQNANAMIQPTVTASGARCTVNNVAFLGLSPTGLRRYEVGCTEGLGYVIDKQGADAPKATDCLAADAGGFDCALTPKAQRTAYIATLAAKGNRPCTVTDGRYMGATARGAQFYEVACGGAQGYVLEVNAGAVTRALDCLEAAGIGQGCKLTNTTAAMEQREGQYMSALRAKSIPCSGTEFRLLGKDSRQRDVVEFVCSDRPAGLVAYMPQAGGDITSFDCFEAEGRGLRCRINKRENMIAVVQRSLSGQSACQVQNFAVLGASATDGLVVEVACAAPVTGFIIDLPESRGAPNSIQTCAQSASRGGERCTLPENK